MAMYFGTIALMAISGSVPVEFRWKVLAFAGIGITAASVLSDFRKLNTWLAMLGIGIVLWGSFIEMNQAAATVGGEARPTILMLVAGIVIYVPLTVLALLASALVRAIIAPVLVTGAAFYATFMATLVIAIIIDTGLQSGGDTKKRVAIRLRYGFLCCWCGNILYPYRFGDDKLVQEKKKHGSLVLPMPQVFAQRSELQGWMQATSPCAIEVPNAWRP